MLSHSARRPLPLARYPRVNTSDFDEATHLFASLVTPVRITRAVRKTPFSWRANHFRLGALDLSASEFIGGVCAESEAPVDDYHISIPLAEARGGATFAKAAVAMVRDKSALVSSPGDTAKVVLQPGFQGLSVTIRSAAVVDAMTTLTGAHVGSLRFHRTLALDAAKTEPFLRALRELLASTDVAGAATSSHGAAERAVESLIFQLLLGHQHNHEASLTGRVPNAEPRYVRRAAEYLEANYARSITMAQLTHETGVGARSLQLGFQRSRGCSPLQFLQQRRLQHARVSLLTGDARAPVSQVAQLAGFHHMGRFSAQYRAHFGETPTSTLARRRRA